MTIPVAGGDLSVSASNTDQSPFKGGDLIKNTDTSLSFGNVAIGKGDASADGGGIGGTALTAMIIGGVVAAGGVVYLLVKK